MWLSVKTSRNRCSVLEQQLASVMTESNSGGVTPDSRIHARCRRRRKVAVTPRMLELLRRATIDGTLSRDVARINFNHSLTRRLSLCRTSGVLFCGGRDA